MESIIQSGYDEIDYINPDSDLEDNDDFYNDSDTCSDCGERNDNCVCPHKRIINEC